MEGDRSGAGSLGVDVEVDVEVGVEADWAAAASRLDKMRSAEGEGGEIIGGEVGSTEESADEAAELE